MGIHTNFCTMNRRGQHGTSTNTRGGTASLTAGNLKYVNLSGETLTGTMGVTSGKWYYEMYIVSQNADNGMAVGWCNDNFNLDAELGYNSPSSPTGAQAFGWYSQTNNLVYGPGDGGGTYNKSWGGGTQMTDGDILGVYLDADNGKFWAAKNGTVFNSGNPATGTGHGFGTGGSPHDVAISSRTLYPAIGNWSVADATVYFNFGQDSSFGGNKSTGSASAADGNGFGDFYYTPATGFNALCSGNAPMSTDLDLATTDTNDVRKNFSMVSYTGNATAGATNAISGLGFQPDLVWIKITNTASNGPLVDSSRGTNKVIFSQITNPEVTSANLASFDSDGFTVNNTSDYVANFNGQNNTYVAWCWKCNGGTTSTNTSGTTTSTVQVNTEAGFSIVQYVGNGSAGNTVGHGLSAAPEWIMIKNRDTDKNWACFHKDFNDSGNHALRLNTSTTGDTSDYWNNTHPSSTVITLGGETELNQSTNDFVAYCWHSVDGYSKFDNYEGNGSTDGAFIYTGFRPKMVFLKQVDGAAEWTVFDDTVGTTRNPKSQYLEWDLDDAISTTTTDKIDFYSNGFKLSGGGGGRTNQDGRTYVYGAWAEIPFRYNNAV